MTIHNADIGQRLETEMRAGVPHYKPDQYIAVTDDEEPDVALLIYVTAPLGWAAIVPCERTDGKWEHVNFACRRSVNGIGTDWEKLPDDFELNEKMIAALENPS